MTLLKKGTQSCYGSSSTVDVLQSMQLNYCYYCYYYYYSTTIILPVKKTSSITTPLPHVIMQFYIYYFWTQWLMNAKKINGTFFKLPQDSLRRITQLNRHRIRKLKVLILTTSNLGCLVY